jgi:SNF2 family DNA or RNA helicase
MIIHAIWQPPHRSDEPGGILFWSETPEAEVPYIWHGRLPEKARVKAHPFCLTPESLREKIGAGTPLADAPARSARLYLPTTRTGPLPSPDLDYHWELDDETDPFLFLWTVDGLWLPASKAFSVLVNLPDDPAATGFYLGPDVRYWRVAANLVLETLTAQKFVPGLVQNGGHTSYARWLPVLDGPQDSMRLTRLAEAIPPVCLAEWSGTGSTAPDGKTLPPHTLLDSFLKVMCDALARTWGRSKAPKPLGGSDDPIKLWLSALFNDDPQVHASPAQLQALHSGHRAWMRNLHASGDSIFRIAFQLEPPSQQSTRPGEKDWSLRYLLQARDDPSLMIPSRAVWENDGAALQNLGRRLVQPQEKLLAGLGYAARLFPPILPSLKQSMPDETTLDTATAYDFLREVAPLLEQSGFGLQVPPWWNQSGARLGLRLRLDSSKPSPGVVSAGKLGMEKLVNYRWELALGNTTLTKDEFESLASLKLPLVQVRGQWVQLDSEQIEAAIRFWDNKTNMAGEFSLLDAARFGLGGAEAPGDLPVTEVVAEGWVKDWLERLEQSDKMVELPQPAGLHGELRPYQKIGYSWLSFFRRWGLGAILADDMGLGKTLQALALLLYEKETQGRLPGPVLLVCPTSVVTNWEREAQRFTPGLTTLVHQGPERKRSEAFVQALEGIDVVLSSYTIVRQDVDWLQQIPWAGIILDEAQNIKNSSAKQSQAVRKLPSTFRFALTGTPVENRLTELWSIMQFLNPGYLGSLDSFKKQFAIPIERFGDAEKTRKLKELISPFLLRRLKSDPRVIQDLPEKIEVKDYCNLSEEQATLYEAVVRDVMKQVTESDGLQRRGLVLSLLVQLKQICNHPLQYLHQVDAARKDPSQINARSAKLIRLVEMLDEVIAEGDRALVFTQFAEMGHLLNAYLPTVLGKPVLYLYGGTPVKLRDQMVRRFQEDPHGPRVFILSLKAGGLGLNLTRANHVFHYDRWWNPAVENQATDRSYRIGQTQNVQVHKFITVGTLEEKIDEMIESKKGLADAIIGGGEDWITELSTDEIREMVSLRR